MADWRYFFVFADLGGTNFDADSSNATVWSSSLLSAISKIRSLSNSHRETSFRMGPGPHLLCSHVICFAGVLVWERVHSGNLRRLSDDAY